MKPSNRFVFIPVIVGIVVICVSALNGYAASGALADKTGHEQALAPQANVTFSVDDGTAEDAIGWDDAWELIFWNRFTPLVSQFPFTLTEIQVYFLESTVTTGDQITLVVYEDKDGDPANGATLLYSLTTTVKAEGTWNNYPVVSGDPVTLNGPGDVLVGVISLEKPAAYYYPAAIDKTTSQHRSWLGWWLSSPPNPSNFPPNEYFAEVNTENFGFDGNWMIRAVGTTSTGPANEFVYLPTILKDYPPIPVTPVLSPISNPNGEKNFTVSWNAAVRAETYLLEEDDNQDFSSPSTVYNGAAISWNAWDKPVGTYYYRVKAHNSWGYSNWSNVVSTTVIPPYPQTPVLSPINNPNNDNDFIVSWSTAINASTYILEEDDNQAFSSPVIVYNGISTSWNASNKPGGTFYYRVKAQNAWGDSSWSNVVSTTVTPPPPPQTTVYVKNNVGCTLYYEIRNTGIGQKSFANGTRSLYGTFPAGSYTWTASTSCCGSGSGTKNFSGEVEHSFTCTASPSSEEQGLVLDCELK